MAITFAVSSYSFARLVGRGEMTQFDTIARAKALGFAAIEFAGLQPPEGEAPLAYAARLREECARQGLQVAAYLTGADFLKNDPGTEAARLCGEVDIAATLGTELMRHDASGGWPAPGAGRRVPTFADALPRLAEGCRAVGEYARARGIRTMVENHGYFCQDSTRVEALCHAVGQDNFGLLFDMGNFLCADENPADAARVLPLAFHVHAKDFLWKNGETPCPGEGWFATRGGNWLRGTVLGHGIVPLTALARKLIQNGYTGTVSLEFEGAEETMPALRQGLDYLRRIFA